MQKQRDKIPPRKRHQARRTRHVNPNEYHHNETRARPHGPDTRQGESPHGEPQPDPGACPGVRARSHGPDARQGRLPGDPTQPDPGAGTSASSLAEGEDARQSGIISSWSYLLLTCSHKGARYADADTQQDERTPAEPYQAAGPGSAASSRPQDQDTRQSGIISSWSLLSLMDTPQGACSEEEAPTVPSLPICLDHTSF